MSGGGTGIWLDACLAPLAPFLDQHDVTDVHVNRPNEVWIERLGGTTERFDVADLSETALLRLARQIAAVTAQGINRANPLLAARLPSGERVQVAIPPATRAHVAISIRKHVVSTPALESYEMAATSQAAERSAPFMLAGHASLLRDAVLSRKNILVAGGTSTGKTTFLNALLQEVPRSERLIMIEDTPELQVSHENVVGLVAVRGSLGEADVTAEDLLIASLRMRPDRIILGEVRGKEAMTFLRAINTGHPGSLTTIHADSPDGAIDQLVMLALQAGSRMRWEDIDQYVRRTIGVIVQLDRVGGRRVIRDVVRPQGGRRAAQGATAIHG